MLAATLLLFAVAVACGDDDDASDVATKTLGTSPTVTAPPEQRTATHSPRPTLPPDVVELSVGEQLDFPADKAFIILTGCYGCDGPAESVVRMYRDAAGTVRQDVLFDPETLGYQPLSDGGSTASRTSLDS